MLKYWIFGILFIGLGIHLFRTPEKVWQRNEAWKSWRTEEPSKAYLLFVKTAAVLMALMGVAVIVLSFFAGGNAAG